VPPEHREIGPDSIVLALRSLFDAEAAAGVEMSCELCLGADRFHVEVRGGELELDRGEDSDAVLRIVAADAGAFAAVLTGELPLAVALEAGEIELEGPRKEARGFLALFPMPEPCPAGRQDAAAGPREHQLA
jgi:alkyl sulfatase BDS1-like metallo-beta-lactamase superfamily hydrolase